MRLTRRLVLAGAIGLASGCTRRRPPPPRLTVYAAASLQDALKAVGDAYTAAEGGEVVFSFAGSSVLARQIEQGARADVFLSADEAWMDYLAERGLVRNDTRRDVASTRLALVAPANAPSELAIAPGFPLAEALGDGRLALADPDSVPAGRYAKAALQSLGVWDTVADKVASAENVRAALAFVARGEAPFGIVYETDARVEPGVRVVGLFPDGTHPPIVYPAAAVASSPSPEAAEAFLTFLHRPQAARAFQSFGFGPPPM